MKLIDLLALVEDSQFVIVSDANNNDIAQYNGVDSIPEKYNDKEIIQIYACNGCIRIQIKLLHITDYALHY